MPSKLASLARSNRGAFDKKGILRQRAAGNLNSVARLAALSSTPPTPPTSPAAVVLLDDASSQATAHKVTESHISESNGAKAFTDPRPDHLLAQESSFANCLFRFHVAPQNAAHLLLGMYTNAHSLAAANDMQSKNAFSTPSPDDVVQRARRPNKGSPFHFIVLIIRNLYDKSRY